MCFINLYNKYSISPFFIFFRLLFSQSLLALDMIEDFLQLLDDGSLELPQPEDPLPLPFKHWKKERDYLRLDGSTSADTRKNFCKSFNNPSNER